MKLEQEEGKQSGKKDNLFSVVLTWKMILESKQTMFTVLERHDVGSSVFFCFFSVLLYLFNTTHTEQENGWSGEKQNNNKMKEEQV